MVKILFNFRLEKREIERMRSMALAEGYSTLSAYVRSKLFSSPSIEIKVNEILNKLNEIQKINGKNEVKNPKF